MQGILTLMQDWIDLKSSDYLIMRASLWPSALWNMSVLKLAVGAKINVSILPLSTRRMEVIKYSVWLYVFYGNRWDLSFIGKTKRIHSDSQCLSLTTIRLNYCLHGKRDVTGQKKYIFGRFSVLFNTTFKVNIF